MKGFAGFGALALALLSAGSCAMLPRRAQEVFLSDPPALEGGWWIGAVEVEHQTMKERIARMAPEAFSLALRKNSMQMAGGQGEGVFLLDLWISEKDIQRGLEMRNSISVTATARDQSGRIVAEAVFAEETDDSIVSFYYLYGIADSVIRNLAVKWREYARSHEKKG